MVSKDKSPPGEEKLGMKLRKGSQEDAAASNLGYNLFVLVTSVCSLSNLNVFFGDLKPVFSHTVSPSYCLSRWRPDTIERFQVIGIESSEMESKLTFNSI